LSDDTVFEELEIAVGGAQWILDVVSEAAHQPCSALRHALELGMTLLQS
jgi:hypothetical protein